MSDTGHPIGAVAAGILLFVAGLVVGVWTIEQWRSEQDRLAAAARIEGTVTGQLNGHPMVTFTLPGGDRVTFTAANISKNDYPLGRKVDVLYPIDMPSHAVIDSPRARILRTALLGALALVVMIVGAYVAHAARRYDARHLSTR